MDAINTILLLYCIYRLHLIGNQQKPPIRVSAPKQEQAPRAVVPYEKPVVPGAKDVKPLPIGGGRLEFDIDNQIAEWI